MTTAFEEARREAGLTVRQAASLLRVNDVTVRRWEMNPDTTRTGRTAPPMAVMVLKWFAQGTPPTFPADGETD